VLTSAEVSVVNRQDGYLAVSTSAGVAARRSGVIQYFFIKIINGANYY
jgi:hypothetical protein